MSIEAHVISESERTTLAQNVNDDTTDKVQGLPVIYYRLQTGVADCIVANWQHGSSASTC